MKNMKIGKKLTVAFLILTLITAVIGGVGIFGMYSLNNSTKELYEIPVTANIAGSDMRGA